MSWTDAMRDVGSGLMATVFSPHTL